MKAKKSEVVVNHSKRSDADLCIKLCIKFN